MTTVLVAMPQTTLNMLMIDADRRRLEAVANVEWRPDLTGKSTEDEYAAAIGKSQAEIVITGWGSPLLTTAILERNPQMKLAVNLTGELKRLIQRDCIEIGLTVTNWGDVPAPSVAEAALMMMLMSLRRAYFWQAELHEKKAWRETLEERWIPQGLFDKTVGLYGFGLIARAFVPMIKPFNPHILVFSSWISEQDQARFGVERVDNLRQLFAESDIVSIHTGRRPDTHHSVSTEILAAMRDGGHIINTARGTIIDTDALIKELKSGRIFAALDVFEQEPLPPDSPLRGLKNCLLFPHQAGPTADYRFRCGTNAVDQIQRYVSGKPLKYVLSLDQYDKMS